MNLTPEINAIIENHLNAVRANLAGQEEAVQNEVLEGLRDHINETLKRQGGNITEEAVHAVLADMDAPESYAEDPVRPVALPNFSASKNSKKWFYVALAFLAVNSVGVWKLIQIDRKTSATEANRTEYSNLQVPYVPSKNKDGIRYPDAKNSTAPPITPASQKAEEDQLALRSIAFLENRNPVIHQPGEELSWTFNQDVVEKAAVGKILTEIPIKLTPSVAGSFQWKTESQLIFKPSTSWAHNQQYTAEMINPFASIDGNRYQGTRFWRFGTANCTIEKWEQVISEEKFIFDVNLTMPVTSDSLSDKMNLHYLTADGEKKELLYDLQLKDDGRTATLTTNIVPAVSFVCEIEPGLQPREWSSSTRDRIELRLLNSRQFQLSSAFFRPSTDPDKQSINLVFSHPVAVEQLLKSIEISPAIAISAEVSPQKRTQIFLRGNFLPATSYEIKINRGLSSLDGCVIPYTSSRVVVIPSRENSETSVFTTQPTFDSLDFSHAQKKISSGKEELTWTFPSAMVGTEVIGQTLQNLPVSLTPAIPGACFWQTDSKLVFRPNNEWELDQYYEVKFISDFKDRKGSLYSGVKFWTISSPPMAIKEIKQINSGASLSFGLSFTLYPSPASVEDKLKAYYYDTTGNKVFLPFYISDNYSGYYKAVTIYNAPVAQIHFSLEPGFCPSQWSKGITKAMDMAAVISSVLEVESITASESSERTPAIRIKLSEGVDVNSAKPFISITPVVKFSIERETNYRHENALRLVGAFEAHREYQVTVKSGLVSERGCLLSTERSASVTIARAAASLSFSAAGGYLSPTGNMLVSIKSQNLTKCKLSVAPVMANNLVYFAKRRNNDSSFSLPTPSGEEGNSNDDYEENSDYDYYGNSLQDLIGNITHKDLNLTEKPNQEHTSYIKLGDFTKSKGAYLVQVSGQDAKNDNSYQRRYSDSRLVVVTDLGISAKRADSHVFVWVCSLKDAKPLANVEVAAYSRNNQFIAKALTNVDGVAAIPCNAKEKSSSPFLVTAQLAEDLSYLALDGEPLSGNAEEDSSSRDYLASGYEAFVFSDRGIYRPGEKLHARTIIRQADFTAPQPFPVVFQILKPDGRLFKEITAMTNAFGAAEIESIIPDFLPTGRYSVNVHVPKAKTNLGSTTFLLEDFVPPQIRVAVKADAERIAAKENLTAEIKSEHLFGSPAAGLKATVKCIYSPVKFSPKQWQGYQFGVDTANDYGRSETFSFNMPPQDIDNLTLDSDGKVTTAIATEVPNKAPGPIRAQIQATVFEQSGRAVTATTASIIDPYPFYIGYKPLDRYWLKSGTEQKIAVVTVQPNGDAYLPVKPLTVRMSRVEWNYSYKANSHGGYSYQSHRNVTLIRQDTLDLASGKGDYTFTPSGYGYTEIAFLDEESGTSSSFSFYTSDYEQSWSTTDREQPDSMTLTLDKKDYSIGENAKLTIQAPFSGTALLTIESDQVLFSRVILLEKNTAEVDVEILPGYAPNVHCTVSVIRPVIAETEWKGHRAFGSVPLRVSPAKNHIQVALEAPATIQPQSKLRTKVSLTDSAGNPVDGEVTLVAVDEAICMLTSFKTPSPLEWLYQLRNLDVKSHDIYSELMEVYADSVLTKESHAAGDGEGESAAERLTKRLNPIKANRFKPVALWSSQIMVKNGVAEIEMDVPEFTGELRLMAIACNATLVGSAQGMVKVKRPLIVQPSLPRFLAPNDQCQMDVTIYNEIGKDITAKLGITCAGPLTTTAKEQEIKIAKGASVSLSIPVQAGNIPGKGLCTVTCEAEDVRFSDTIEIAVRPPISADVSADSGSLAPGKSIVIQTQGNWIPASIQRKIAVSKEPSLELAGGLQFLLRYPHGCIEQTTSAAFPLLYLPDLANQTFDKSMTQESVKRYVNSGIWRILSMQQANGGFSYWPGYNEIHPWGSSYATHFLIEAKKAGYEVPQNSLDRAIRALRDSVDAIPSNQERDTYFHDNLSYACYVLALGGQPTSAWVERMLEKKNDLSYYARLMNATTLLLRGDPKRAVVLLDELGLPGASARDMGGCFNSSTRNAALLLSAWLDIDPKNEDVFQLVNLLSKTRINGYWGTTQDSAMAIMALGKYAQRTKGDVREFQGSISLPDGTTETFDHTKNHTWEFTRGEMGSITLTNSGPGIMYYNFHSEGVPIDTAEYYKRITANNRGLSVTREWLDDEGNTIDPSKVKQNDLVVVKISLHGKADNLDNLVIEDLLPAGLEIENPHLDTAQALPWLSTHFEWCSRRDIRDDRVLIYTKYISDNHTFYYLARAVTPGKFTVPPISAEAMYDPEVRSITSQTEMTIVK